MGFDDPELTQESQHDELWLISYADMLTLLVGFFVLIIASMPMKRARFERIAAALSGTHQAAPLEDLKDKVDQLIARTPALRDKVRTRDDAEGLGIEFRDAMLFDSGSAVVRAEAQPAIGEIARLLRELPRRPVTVEGHTDDVPISTASFHSNWELSSQRAINVLQALQSAGVERERMSARALADTRPLPAAADQDVELRRAVNRRVVIRVE
ncbi:MAG TPA: flagellar motor protein MotB [Myxococcales bacterium]|jgi:chemotaxis protein MotB|nr:flagellar motor protein MotB [Myxococcales bacterium]